MAKKIVLPYVYFMDTQSMSDLCTIVGHDDDFTFEIQHDIKPTISKQSEEDPTKSVVSFGEDHDVVQSISIMYRPSETEGSTRSIVSFGGDYVDWKYPEAHMFHVVAGIDNMPSNLFLLVRTVLFKFHEMLKIAYCKFIGHDKTATLALRFSALFAEIAPWTLTLAINPTLSDDVLKEKIKEKHSGGKHVFCIVQNRLDEPKYRTLLSMKTPLSENGIQGWSFQTPPSTFYHNTKIAHGEFRLDRDNTFAFIDWISTGSKSAEFGVAVYKLNREF
jgi:hypothetical protein